MKTKKIRMTVRLLPALVSALVLAWLPCSPAAGGNVSPTGAVTAWGDNNYGQLGNGTTISSSTPVPVALPPGVVASAIAAGFFHNLALTNDGVYAWGGGLGGTPSHLWPIKIALPTLFSPTAIVAGGFHSVAITADGQCYAWGGNDSGQLGDGTTTDSATPVRVLFPSSVTRVKALAAGARHNLAITNDGVYAWGLNSDGQLGDGTRVSKSLPVRVDLSPSNLIVVSVAAGDAHSIANTEDGLYTWGSNIAGQLGDGSLADSAVPVLIGFGSPPASAFLDMGGGSQHTLVVAAFGGANSSILTFGYNGFGQLGDGTTIDSAVPVKIAFPNKVLPLKASAGPLFSLAATTDGDVYAWGSNAAGQLGLTAKSKLELAPAKVKAERNVIDVAAGFYHSLALH
jgi:alpha-tubulin suppressor-like RCC1 family protein